jgi:hypothetical protein
LLLGCSLSGRRTRRELGADGLDFGYYDESHMINDIRALAGATPQAMLEERARTA